MKKLLLVALSLSFSGVVKASLNTGNVQEEKPCPYRAAAKLGAPTSAASSKTTTAAAKGSSVVR